MTANHSDHFTCHRIAKVIHLSISLVFVMTFFLSFGKIPIFKQLLMLFPTYLFVHVAISVFHRRIMLDEEGITVQADLSAGNQRYQWEDIRAVKTMWYPLYWLQYMVIPREPSRRGFIVSREIKDYKRLLRLILCHVPSNTQLDPGVIKVSGFLNSSEGRQRLNDIRQQNGPHPS